MVARQADREEIVAALFEHSFGGVEEIFAYLFHGHGTGHRMGGRRAISEMLR